MKEIKTESDWFWYTQRLNLEEKTIFEHEKPIKFPCLVKSVLHDGGDYRDWYSHTFFYQKELICNTCGTKKTEWDYESTLQSE